MISAFFFAVLLGGAALIIVTAGGSPVQNSPETRDAQRKADLMEIQLGATLYRDANGVFPASLEVMVPEYLSAVPNDPGTGEQYSYVMYAEGIDYEVCTVLETVSDFEGIYCEFGLELGGTDEIDLKEI
jgi:hypothetical protein